MTIAGLAVNLAAIPCMAVVQVAAMVDGRSRRGRRSTSLAGLAGWVTHLGVRGLIDSARLVDARAVADVARARRRRLV